MRKSVKIALAIVVGLPILAGVAIRLFVDANTFRPVIESRLTTALSRKVNLGNLSFSVVTGSLVANDLTIAEDPRFGQTPFFSARQLHIGVEMKPLIFDHKLIVRSVEVDGPQIHLIRAEDGAWNFSTLSHGAGSQNTTQPATLHDLTAGLITIKDGHVKIETLPLQGNPLVYDHLDVKMEQFSLAKSFPFTVSASLPGDGEVNLSGTVGPINPQDTASTAFDAQVSIKHLDPLVAGYVDPAAGISMIADLDAHIVSNGVNVTSDGKAHIEHLILLKGGKAAPNPVDINYQVSHSLTGNSGQVSDLALQTGAVAIHIKGTYQLTANVPIFDLKLLAQSVPIDSLRALMPAVGVKLPNGAVLKGGTLSANFSIKGSTKDNVIVGSYEIKNTQLVGYDLGSKIHGIAAMSGINTGDITAIEISRANMRISKSGSETTNIYSVLPALGESTGSGTVSPSGALNFHLICKVTNAKGLNKVGVNILTKLNSTSAAGKPSAATGIPINITGTAENPVITADISGLAKGNATALRSKSTAILNKTGIPGLFGKKK
jgi:AsmA protein